MLHLTAHLGGGVGKVMSGLARQAAASGAGVTHSWICFEQPECLQFVDQIRETGCGVDCCPAPSDLAASIDAADMVQLEWWNHPATFEALCSLPEMNMRLLVWSHVSGLHTPLIPPALLEAAHRFLFTSPCSFNHPTVAALGPQARQRLDVVVSSGGFAGLPGRLGAYSGPLRAGYVGSLNFSKLHPRYVDYLAAVDLSGFTVSMIGVPENREILSAQCQAAGHPKLLNFVGYRTDMAQALSEINVLVYLLNPKHYGTAENALLEAMAMGVVPVVLDNPAERCIVQHGETGLVVQTPEEFATAMHWLYHHTEEREAMGQRAAQSVRDRFSAEQTETGLRRQYIRMMDCAKQPMCFKTLFGTDPASWFLACQENHDIFSGDSFIERGDAGLEPMLYERSKGSVFHFSRYFPKHRVLKRWADKLNAYNEE